MAAVGALAMVCMAVPGFAENSTSFEQVRVLDNESNVMKTYTAEQIAAGGVSLSPGQLLEVTVKLSGEEDEYLDGAQATFLSHLVLGEEDSLDNTTIQYVDQDTIDEDGTIVVKFRPRTTIGTDGLGSFVAMAGGTDVATANTFNYTVKEADKIISMSITSGEEMFSNDLTNIVITISGDNGVPAGLTEVKIDDTTVPDTGYTYDSETGTLTILAASLAGDVDDHSISIAADGFIAPTPVTYVVNQRQNATIENPEDSKDALDDMTIGDLDDNYTVTLPSAVEVDGDSQSVAYTLPEGAALPDGVSMNKNKLTLDHETRFAAKVVLNASVGVDSEGNPVAVQKTVYLIPKNTTISYGNVGLFADANGEDAFADDDAYRAAIAATGNEKEILANRAIALNFALGRGDKNKDVPQFDETLDYDKDGKLVLAEYRIFKLMMGGADGYAPSDITTAREAWLASHQ